jgi:type 1 glutamine amidotransferase
MPASARVIGKPANVIVMNLGLVAGATLLSFACGSTPARSTTSAAGKVIVYTHSTGFRHASIEAAANAFAAALAAQGFQPELVANPSRISTAGLTNVRGIVMISTTGKPFGDPGDEALAAFEAFVKGGGALIGVHAASSSLYDPSSAQTRMMGGKFTKHPGGVRAATCYTEGTNAAVAKLPASFEVRDEIYLFDAFNNANQVVLRCTDVSGNERLPIAWTRNEGVGRVFYSALGHSAEDYSDQSRVFRDHLLPGTLWALGQ